MCRKIKAEVLRCMVEIILGVFPGLKPAECISVYASESCDDAPPEIAISVGCAGRLPRAVVADVHSFGDVVGL